MHCITIDDHATLHSKMPDIYSSYVPTYSDYWMKLCICLNTAPLVVAAIELWPLLLFVQFMMVHTQLWSVDIDSRKGARWLKPPSDP